MAESHLSENTLYLQLTGFCAKAVFVSYHGLLCAVKAQPCIAKINSHASMLCFLSQPFFFTPLIDED